MYINTQCDMSTLAKRERTAISEHHFPLEFIEYYIIFTILFWMQTDQDLIRGQMFITA